MGLTVRAKINDSKLFGRWGTGVSPGGLGFTAEFISPNAGLGAEVPGEGVPDPMDPRTLRKLPAIPSKRVVVSLLGSTFEVEGKDWSDYVTAFDLVRPMNGETQGVIELRTGRNLDTLNPAYETSFSAGKSINLSIKLPGQVVPLLLNGYIVEPPKFKIDNRNVGALSLRIGDLFLLKRQSETGKVEPYCGELPRTTAQAAQVFAQVRGLPGVWGGEAIVENVNPDFVEGPPWDFLSSLYEVLNYDVRTTSQGVPIAVPRTVFNPDTALVLEDYQVSEAEWDSPSSLPFSVVPGFNNFNRDLGYRANDTVREDYSRWNPGDTRAWFISNNTYQIIKTTTLGDTPVQVVTETWGYIPNNTVVPSDAVPSNTVGPCGEFIPPPQVEAVTTRLDLIQTQTYRAYFEPHLSGSYVIVGTETTTQGWNTFQRANADTELYFGQLEGSRETFIHTAIQSEGVCPQYWDVVRVASEELAYGRVSVGENTEPEFRLTARTRTNWAESTEEVSEGQVQEWKSTKVTERWDVSTARWIGGELPDGSSLSPPSATFINSFKVPVRLEVETQFPELTALFGEREAKPIQFPNAYTTRDLLVATERYARETAGLAYSIHLLVDPRVPIRPGAAIRYKRPGQNEVHGLAWTVEYNVTGNQATQSVVLLRTFTEPGLAAIRNNPDYLPVSQVDAGNPCI